MEQSVDVWEGLSQVEAVPFTLVTLRLRRDANGLVAAINDTNWFRATEGVAVDGDLLDLPTKIALNDTGVFVHFGDRFETLQRWEPSEAERPQWRLEEASCPRVGDLLQGRWADKPVADSQRRIRKDLSVLREIMVETLMAKLGELAAATVGRRSAVMAGAVQFEAAERGGERRELQLLQGHSNDETPFGPARYRIAGNTVQFFGAVSRVYSPDKTLAFVLPEDARPAAPAEVQVRLDPSENTAEAVLLVGTDGQVFLLSLARFSQFNPAPASQTIMLNGTSFERDAPAKQ